MNDLELMSLLWLSIAVVMLVGVVVAAIRLGLDEQAERERQDRDQ